MLKMTVVTVIGWMNFSLLISFFRFLHFAPIILKEGLSYQGPKKERTYI